MYQFKLWHFLLLSVNISQAKKPLSEGHKGLRLTTCEGTPRVHQNTRQLSTSSKHSLLLHHVCTLCLFQQVLLWPICTEGTLFLQKKKKKKKKQQLTHFAENGTVNWTWLSPDPWLLPNCQTATTCGELSSSTEPGEQTEIAITNCP